MKLIRIDLNPHSSKSVSSVCIRFIAYLQILPKQPLLKAIEVITLLGDN